MLVDWKCMLDWTWWNDDVVLVSGCDHHSWKILQRRHVGRQIVPRKSLFSNEGNICHISPFPEPPWDPRKITRATVIVTSTCTHRKYDKLTRLNQMIWYHQIHFWQPQPHILSSSSCYGYFSTWLGESKQKYIWDFD